MKDKTNFEANQAMMTTFSLGAYFNYIER